MTDMPDQEKRYNLTPFGNNEIIQPRVNMPIYKPLKTDGRKITESTKKRLRTKFMSMGMVIPFQPSIWDDKSIEEVWQNTIQKLKRKMNETYTNEVINGLIDRLNKLFTKLNFSTHRKSLAIILSPGEERVIYLNFPVKPVIFLAKNISVLELAANIRRDVNFFYLVLDEKNAELYDFGGGRLRKIYDEKGNPGYSTLSQKVIYVIELLNSETGNPVFVTGSPSLVESFCNSHAEARAYFPLLYNISPFSKHKIQSLAHEITTQWDYWRSKSIRDKILLVKNENRIIIDVEPVLQALGKGMDGILLLDKRLKKQLQKPALGNIISSVATDLNTQIERFLMRGNLIEITETGLLRGFGGIALLPNWKKIATSKIQHKTIPGRML